MEQCIESVIAQDYQNYELILVDDGSPDNSIDICIKYAKKYKNIIVIHKINGGLSDARNAGIKVAQGEYLIFLDSDDYWDGTKILTEISQLIQPEYPDVIFHDMTFYNEIENKLKPYITNKNNLTGNYREDFLLLTQNTVFRPSAWTKIVKRSILIKNELFFKVGIAHEDLDWSFELARKINSYKIYNSPFYIYRTKRFGSITTGIKAENVNDLLDIGIEKLIKLNDMKNIFLYKGLKQYFLYEGQYIIDSFKLLKGEEKSSLQGKYNTFENLFNLIK
nr:glycosyltransferase family 2 protein [Haemophilus parahaemolyticus]